MSSFFISPFKPPEEWFGESDLEVDPMSLMGNLQSRWPSIDITPNPTKLTKNLRSCYIYATHPDYAAQKRQNFKKL